MFVFNSTLQNMKSSNMHIYTGHASFSGEEGWARGATIRRWWILVDGGTGRYLSKSSLDSSSYLTQLQHGLRGIPGTRHLVPSAKCLVSGARDWELVPGTRHPIPGTVHGTMAPRTRYQIPGTRHLVPGTWQQVPGARYRVPSIKISKLKYQAPAR